MSPLGVQEIASSKEENTIKIDQIAKVRGWFRQEDDSRYYPIVERYLTSKNAVEETTKELLAPIDELISAERLDDANILDLWYSIIHSARRISFRTPHEHQKLVDLVANIKTHSIPSNEKSNHIYSSLTDFSMACREAYNDEPTPGSSTNVEILAWANLNFFYALLTSKEVADTSLYAIWAMRQALETPQTDDEESTALQKYNTYVPAAFAWVAGASSALYLKEVDLTPKDRKFGNPARGGELWKGKAEFSRERWNLWSGRFAEIGEMEGVSDETRVCAKDAVQAMEKAGISDNA
ncbi:hypothetical protein GQ44DRAFT_736700 [Phaeosphaeriaceae sp. PMI808]|nr:hypothetical protein GQ44DRAFT_736700 [Phaeosphaeriaceae sp. PMI808]